MDVIIKYEISKDGKGLVAYLKSGTTYHIHNDELIELERWIFEILNERR